MVTCFDNGVRVVTSKMRQVQSAALGVWIKVNPLADDKSEAGYLHFLEHLLFKGCKRFSGLGLAGEFEAMGGRVTAQTGKELTDDDWSQGDLARLGLPTQRMLLDSRGGELPEYLQLG